MKRMQLIAVGALVFALAGCGKEATSTAPNKNDPNSKKKLTVKAPMGQTITQDKTDEFSVSVDRDNFAGDITIELRDLPSGVSLVTSDMKIPAGKDSVSVTIKATADAKPVVDHVVKVAAKATEMPEAVSEFKLTVKAK